MTLWTIEPRDPILLRDGRPFGLAPGARAESLEFPFPSTVAGAARTQAGIAAQNPFAGDSAEPLLQIAVRGPLLVEVGDDGDALQWYAPAPADAVLLGSAADTEKVNVRRMAPQPIPAGAATDLDGLAPVGMMQPDKAKPFGGAPHFWNWATFEKWLQAPDNEDGAEPSAIGHSGPTRESRVHVTIQADKQTAAEGRLFQTKGMEFTYTEGGDWGTARALGIALAVESASPAVSADFPAGYATLGGERRLVRWQKRSDGLPACPDSVRKDVIAHKACRVLLLTPAVFEAGDRPAALLTVAPGVQAAIVGMAVPRAQVVSGWDYAASKTVNGKIKYGRPKATRRLAPAGSVYFLKLQGTDAAIGAFVDRVWMQCVSDGIQGSDIGQNNRDGFGLAAVGVWPEGETWKGDE